MDRQKIALPELGLTRRRFISTTTGPPAQWTSNSRPPSLFGACERCFEGLADDPVPEVLAE
jgi:hypothetical protein